MKFRIEQSVLADAAAWTAKFVPAKPLTPTLAAISLEAKDGQVSLSAYDHDASGRHEVPADVHDTGTALVNGRLLADIVRSLPDAAVEVVVDSAKATLSCGASRFQLNTLPVEEWPALPEMPPPIGVVDLPEFAQAVSQVALAASRDDMLPQLTGVRLEAGPEELILAATDRYRLAVRRLPWKASSSEGTVAALLPGRTLADTTKSLTGSELVLSLGESGIFGLTTEDRQASSRLIDADFPDFKSLLPKEAATVVTIDRAALVSAVKRVALVTERNQAVRLIVGDDEVTLQAQSGVDDSEASEVVAAEVTGAGDLETGFNPVYLLDGLGALLSDEATLTFLDERRPAVIADAGSEAYRYVIMPVRLNG